MIFIDNRQNRIEFTSEYEKIIKELIDCALKEEGVSVPYEVSMILIDNGEIRKINREMRNIDRATDVLSFPMLEYPDKKVFKETYADTKLKDEYLDDGDLVLGDIALSLERAQEQSVEFGHSFIRECTYLTVHSILHLLGYDHMIESDKKVMRKREEEILEKFNLGR